MNYIKLKDEPTFTVIAVRGFVWKSWSKELNKMEESPIPKKGFTKKWSLETDKGVLEISQSNMGTLLELCLRGTVSDLTNETFKTRTNGLTGLDIRYWFDRVPKPVEDEVIVRDEEPLQDMPF